MDDVITLIKEKVTGHDQYGNEIREEYRREVFCQVFSITRNEFYSAATANLHPELTVRLSDFMDYEGEKLALYAGSFYSIIRTYRDQGPSAAFNAIELILQRKVGDQ